MEVWKDIPGYEGLYKVSNMGNVWSIYKRRKLHGGNLRGYKILSLYKDKVQRKAFCHRLVAMTFIPNYDNKLYVDHIDGNTLNNKLENLEWVVSLKRMEVGANDRYL